METLTSSAPQQAPTAPAAYIQDDELVARCQALVRGFANLDEQIETNRDAFNLDITSEEARERKIVAANEAYIGRRVIAGNIKRELPTFIQFLSGSFRHITVRGRFETVPASVCGRLEWQFTNAFRQGGWLKQHIQTIISMALHGRGIFLVVPSAENPLGVEVAYVPPEDFIFPPSVRDIQQAPMIGIGYKLTSAQLKSWAALYGWNPSVVAELTTNLGPDDLNNKTFQVYRMLYRQEGYVHGCWYSHDCNRLLSSTELFNTGFYNGDGTIMPHSTYPVFPVYYAVSENPAVAEQHGRAHEDMHDQEALTLIHTGVVNTTIRASELYISSAEQAVTESPQIVQSDFVVQPGKVLKQKVQFFTPPAPDSNILITAQMLRTENASAAGQVDFAAQARKDSRKTAKELSLAEQQTAQVQTVALTSFSLGYAALLQYLWDVVANNVGNGLNTTFLTGEEDLQSTIAAVPFIVSPAGDVDFVERQNQLSLMLQYLPLFEGTPVALYFRQKIIELAFPNEFPRLGPLLQDNSKQLGAAMYHIMSALPPDLIPPDMQPKMAEIMSAAAQAFNVAPENTAQSPNGPAVA